MAEMKTTASLLLASTLLTQTLSAQSTGFSYHGILSDGGSPANGLYDITFTGFNAVIGGQLIGGPVTNSAILVTNGMFITTVDLGTGPFAGNGVWLELAVSSNSANSFTILSPRQPVTPVPYALFAFGSGTNASQTNAPNDDASFISNNATGVSLSGTFDGNGSGLTNIPTSSLVGPMPNGINQVNGAGTGTHLTDATLIGDGNVTQTFIVNRGTFEGSTLGLVNLSYTGYTDINFFDTGYLDAHGVVQPVSLRGALGVGSPFVDQFPYNSPYWECYGQNSFSFVQYAQVFGMVNGTNGDFVWYRFKTSDADESTKMFEIHRPRTNVVSFVPLIISNTPSGPAALDIGANQAAALWVSNGVVYLRTSSDGVNTSDKQIAP